MSNPKSFENVGVVWYTKDEWGKMKDICIDKERFEETYEDWEAMVARTVAEMKKAGLKAIKVYVTADEFRDWCAHYSYPMDASSRSRFIVEKEMGAER